MPKFDNARNNKAVTFHKEIFIVLIPSREVYSKRGMIAHLWWGLSDYTDFRRDQLKDVNEFMKSRKISSARLAKKVMYRTDSYSEYNDDTIEPIEG